MHNTVRKNIIYFINFRYTYFIYHRWKFIILLFKDLYRREQNIKSDVDLSARSGSRTRQRLVSDGCRKARQSMLQAGVKQRWAITDRPCAHRAYVKRQRAPSSLLSPASVRLSLSHVLALCDGSLRSFAAAGVRLPFVVLLRGDAAAAACRRAEVHCSPTDIGQLITRVKCCIGRTDIKGMVNSTRGWCKCNGVAL